MVAENRLSVEDLIWPLFVHEGGKVEAVPSMPGVSRQTISAVVDAVGMAGELGVPAVAIFPVIPLDRKTPTAEEALDPDNLCNRAVRAIKKAVPDVGIICDVALDPYTSHGHDGVMAGDRILNDETVEILCKQAVAQAEAGIDICAPSDMMDGRIGRIRDALDAAGHDGVASSPMRRNMPRASTARSAMRSAPNPTSARATSAPTRWIRPTATRRSGNAPSTWPRVRTC